MKKKLSISTHLCFQNLKVLILLKIIKNKEKKTGCTVHYVNKKLDDGGIILKKMFYLKLKDDEVTKKKTQSVEYKAYPEAIIKIFRNYLIFKKKLNFFFRIFKESEPCTEFLSIEIP